MPRYLLNYSYIGTNFSGAQRLIKAVKNEPRPDCRKSINGQLEIGLKVLNPQNNFYVVGSSRTDAGVHALNTTCHVDLQRRNGIYEPDTVTICLNKHFKENELPIRIIRTRIVPDDFHCRHRAISRTYLYRMMISFTKKIISLHHFPIEELDRCYFRGWDGEFNLDKMKEAAKLLEGYHDFRTFMGKTTTEKLVTRRTMEYIKIIEKDPPKYSDYSWPSCALSNPADYIHLDIYFKANGFLYRQVRRTAGALVATACGKISIRDVRSMLEVPSCNSWPAQCKSLPAKGLFLCEVKYREEDELTFE